MSKLCFSADFTGSFSLCRTGKCQTAHRLERGKANFTVELKALLEKCTIEQDDAINVIRQYDSPGAFHYLAPPYVNCNMGHYENMFGEENLRELLDTISGIQGKFMLTMYPNDMIRKYAETNDWTIHRINRTVSAENTKRRKQEEWMVCNYALPEA
jgi:DNA adenine methylase